MSISIKDILSKNEKNKMEILLNDMKDYDEYEIMFFNKNMTLEKFLYFLKYANYRNKNDGLNIKKEDTLDIIYDITNNMKDSKRTTIRITIENLQNINMYMNSLAIKNNDDIFKTLLNHAFDEEKNIYVIKKTKDHKKILDIDELNIRLRVSEEQKITKKEYNDILKINTYNGITYRYKQRVSLKILDDEYNKLNLDITNVKTANNMNDLLKSLSEYEIELDLQMTKAKPKLMDKIYDEIDKIIKLYQQNNYIMTNSIQKEVMNNYCKILNINDISNMKRYWRQGTSLEYEHLNIIINKYAVTDKADGERYNCYIMNKKVYLIKINGDVLFTGIILNNNKYDNTIMDGEYIYIPKYKRYILLIFDCIMINGKEMQNLSLNDKLNAIDDVIKNCFIFNEQKGFIFNEQITNNNSLLFYETNLKKYYKSLSFDCEINKNVPLIRKKYFIFPLGKEDSEIFKYSSLIWNKCIYDNVDIPYNLDGLIYQPLIYNTGLIDYKWKPQNKNSIDFYIEFLKNDETQQDLIVFDNTNDALKNLPYKICHLYVGQSLNKNDEIPVLFLKDEKKYICYIQLKDGEARDICGGIINDKTVVEFYYNLDSDNVDPTKWIPMRTRYDKTESVIKYKKIYGNNIVIATRIWRSILNPIKISDIDKYAMGQKFDVKNNYNSTLINHPYYQQTTDLASPMRKFHNWIKENMIIIYCNKIYRIKSSQTLSIFDIACGRGGDINKFINPELKISLYVGIDVSYDGLFSIGGAQSRYDKLKNKTNILPMFFIHADAGALLQLNDQQKAIGTMSYENKILIEKYFDGKYKFDIINCQFAMHYFLKNNITWKNFCDNINNHLNMNGYILITTTDEDCILKLLNGNDKYTAHYTNLSGQKKILFEIIKKYDEKSQHVGKAIDVFNSIISNEDIYNTEYVVNKQFLIDEFYTNCGLTLIDTNTFSHIYELHRKFFTSTYKFEENIKKFKYFEIISNFYNTMDDVNLKSLIFSQLNRFYVFKKIK